MFRLSQLKNLENLTLSGNDMKAGLPDIVGELTNLRKLSISWCTTKLPDR